MVNLQRFVRHLININALHKKKQVRLGEETWDQVLYHLQEEVDELVQAFHALRHETKKNHSQVLEELGDIYGILVHAALKAGFSMAQVEHRELVKLRERFEYDVGNFQIEIQIQPKEHSSMGVIEFGLPQLGDPYPNFDFRSRAYGEGSGSASPSHNED